MRELSRTFNFATPVGVLVAVLSLMAIVGLILIVASGAGFRWDPFNSAERRAARAEGQAARATQDAAARTIEARGAQDTTRLVEAAAAATADVEQVAAHQSEQARAAHDANVPLDPDRAGRLSDGDLQLCAIRPTVCADHPAAP